MTSSQIQEAKKHLETRIYIYIYIKTNHGLTRGLLKQTHVPQTTNRYHKS